MVLYAGPLTILPRYQGSMRGRPGMLLAWSYGDDSMDYVKGWYVYRHYSGQTDNILLRSASAEQYGGTLWDNVPGFVPRYLQHQYNNELQKFGWAGVRNRAQSVPCNAGQVIRSFSFQIKCPSGRSNKNIVMQIHDPAGNRVWRSQEKLINSTSFAWIRENPNYVCQSTGRYKLAMRSISEENSAYGFGVRMDDRNPYPWGNASYYHDDWGVWYTNPGWSMVFRINGGVWAFVDHYAPGSGELTYWVYPYHADGSAASYKSGHITHDIKGVWLIPTRKAFGSRFSPKEESLATFMYIKEPINFEIPEHQTIFRPIGKRAPVVKSMAPPGYDFTITGTIREFAGLSANEYRRRLEILYGYTNELTIVFVGQGMSFPVVINNLKLMPIKAGWYEMSLDCHQSGDFTISEMLTVPAGS